MNNGGVALLFLLSFETDADRDKFEFLYAKYKNLLMHKAIGILRDHNLAEDAVSEAYLRVYRNLHKIDDSSSNSAIAFLVTIVRNVALTMLQKAKAEVPDEFDEERPDAFRLEDAVLSGIASSEIFAILGQMDESLRDIFIMKYAYDLTHKEIASALGLTENNVTVRLHRAKKKLAEILAKEGCAHD